MTWTSEPPESELPTTLWDDLGVPVWPTRNEALVGDHLSWDGSDLLFHALTGSFRVSGTDIVLVRPIDPWPELFVAWESYWQVASAVARPEANPGSLARDIDGVVAALQSVRGEAVQEGWILRPGVAWEPVEHFPGEGGAATGAAGYRQRATRTEWVRAVRDHRRAMERLGAYLRRHLRMRRSTRRRQGVRRVAATDEHLYIERDRGEMARIALNQLWSRQRVVTSGLPQTDRTPPVGEGTVYRLTTRHDDWIVWPTGHRIRSRGTRPISTEGGHTTYVFGRNTELRLPYRKDCPLAALLDERLTDLRAEARAEDRRGGDPR
ncbi:MAG: hypothetical protein KC416_00615 [Myxococcales bacterium]|nr:hypothetical protein [Myxococcales bacterium]